jgi:hypothetical protein
MKGLQKIPAVHQNLHIAFTDCTFQHLIDGQVFGEGVIVRALNSECLDAMYRHSGEREEHRVVLTLSDLHYDAATRSGFYFSPAVHDYGELG